MFVKVSIEINIAVQKYTVATEDLNTILVRYLKVTSISLQWVKIKSFISERSLQ